MIGFTVFSLLAAYCADNTVSGFTSSRPRKTTTMTELQMGLFDGVKEAFAAPALERSEINKERETPIDRWMGWSVVSEKDEMANQAAAADFIDTMDDKNYVSMDLSKPMGIVFEENDEDYGGIFVQSLAEGGAAETNGGFQKGDQLVAVDSTFVTGLPFDEALGTIVDAQGETTKLTLFRGSAKQFYGPTGPSQEWLKDFIASVTAAAAPEAAPAAEPAAAAESSEA